MKISQAKLITTLLILVAVITMNGCNQVTKEEAVSITGNFVRQHLKVYSEEESIPGNTTNIIAPNVQIHDMYDNDKGWNVILHIHSNQTGELKKKGIVIVIDKNTGEIKKEKLRTFDI